MLQVYIEYMFDKDIIPFIYDDVIDISFDNVTDFVTFSFVTPRGIDNRTLKKSKIKKINIGSTNY